LSNQAFLRKNFAISNDMRFFLIRLIPIIIIALLGVWGVNYWKNFTPEEGEKAAQKEYKSKGLKLKKNRVNGLEVQVLTANKQDYQVFLNTSGVVSTQNRTNISPEVPGVITWVNDQFSAGSFVKKGEVLARIDDTSLKAGVITAEATLARAEAELAQEMARGEQALRNWTDIGFKEKPNDLVLRVPQLKETKANVKSAKSSLLLAQAGLKKAEVKAPYTGRISSRTVGIGQSVGPNSELGEMFATDTVDVRLPLSYKQLNQIGYAKLIGSEVTLKNAIDTQSPTTWSAKIVRIEGELDEESRELNIIAQVTDPYRLNTPGEPLFINQPVNASIKANLIKDVYLINRDYTHELKNILVVKDGKIATITLEPIWEDDTNIIVNNNIPDGIKIITSKHSYAPIGTAVYIPSEQPSQDTEVSKDDKKLANKKSLKKGSKKTQ